MNSSSTNIWYLDRGKNFFTVEGKDFFETMIAIFNTYKNEMNEEFNIIEKFPGKYKNSGNPAALLTTLRNIGIINKENKLADNIRSFYVKNRLTYDELIFENLTKINYDKENTAEVKPFVIICQMIYALYCINPDFAYITKDECVNYLFNITSYDKDTIDKIAKEISNTQRITSSESVAVLDIWFNALGSLPFFKLENRNVLKVELDEIEFFKYVYENGDKIKHYYYGEDRRFKNAYDELGSISTGINEIIPKVNLKKEILKEVFKEKIDYERIIKYLFGIQPDERVSKIFENDVYGIYKPFNAIRNIAIRKIWSDNKKIGNELFDYNAGTDNGNIYNNHDMDEQYEEENEDSNPYINSLISIIKDGKVNTTYKYVLAKAIVKRIIQMVEENDVNEKIVFDEISKFFIEHYWNEVVKDNLKQSYNGSSKAIDLIVEFQQEFKLDYDINQVEIYKEHKEIIENYSLYKYIIKKFNDLLKLDVIQRFCNMSNINSKIENIYEYDLNNQYISIDEKNIMSIYENRDLLMDIIEKRLDDIVHDMNNIVFDDTEEEILINQKKDAEILLKSNNIDLTYREWSYAKNQVNKDTFWINPPCHLVEHDWYIVLNNQLESKLIVLFIPKNTLVISNKNDRYLKCRKDRPQYIDMEIYIKDLRIRGTDYYLDKYIYKIIDY